MLQGSYEVWTVPRNVGREAIADPHGHEETLIHQGQIVGEVEIYYPKSVIPFRRTALLQGDGLDEKGIFRFSVLIREPGTLRQMAAKVVGGIARSHINLEKWQPGLSKSVRAESEYPENLLG